MKWLIILLLGWSMLSSCKGMRHIEKQQVLTTTPEKLQLFVDQQTDPYTIKVNYTLNIPAGFISPCAQLVYQPYFSAAGNRYDLTPLVISGKEYKRRAERLRVTEHKRPACPDAMQLIFTGDGMKVKLSQTVPFQLWMTDAKLRGDVILETCRHSRDISVLTLATGVIYLPEGPGPVRVKYVKEKQNIHRVARYRFLYPTGGAVLMPAYDGNSSVLQKMAALMDSLGHVAGMKLEKIMVTGYSSPSGALSFNQELALRRAKRMKQELISRFHIASDLIHIGSVPGGWQGIEPFLRQADFPDADAFLKILQGNYTFEERKALFSRLPQYKEIALSVYPQLQKVECEFYYTSYEEVDKIVPL